MLVLRLIFRDIYDVIQQIRARGYLRKNGLICSSTAIIKSSNLSKIQNGKNCSIGDYSIIDITSEIQDDDEQTGLTLGDFVYIGEQCNIRASGSKIIVGSHTMIANNTVIVSANHLMELGTLLRLQNWDQQRRGVVIEEDCWIGSHTTILPGTIIGKGSIIAAGAVVRGTIPPFTIWGGVPAKQIRQR